VAWRALGGRTLAAREIRVDHAGQIHAGDRARVVAEVEPRVDLEQVQPPVVVALEVELGDAPHA
jgi:hypothetical protein